MKAPKNGALPNGGSLGNPRRHNGTERLLSTNKSREHQGGSQPTAPPTHDGVHSGKLNKRGAPDARRTTLTPAHRALEPSAKQQLKREKETTGEQDTKT